MFSEHFTRSEFACKCGCGFAAVDAELLQVLERLRELFEAPVVISSGCRCKSHNAAVGGSPNSQHLLGLAADIVIKGVEPADVAKTLVELYTHKYGIGVYAGWVHIDVRKNPARWGKVS